MREDRRGFLRRAAVTAGGLAAAGDLAPAGRSATGSDRGVVALLLSLERLKSAFYRETAERAFVLGEELAFARAAHTHDKAHAAFLMDALGGLGATPPRPSRYGFRGVTTDPSRFRDVAMTLEEVSVGAYVWEVAEIGSTPLRRRLASILSVESGQLAWIRQLAASGPRQSVVPVSFAPALEPAQVRAIIDSTGFVRD